MSLITLCSGRAAKVNGGRPLAPVVGKVMVAVAALSLLATLSGCSGIARALGGSKRPPDEFTVVGRAPLVVPPDYNLMPPKDNKPEGQRKTDVDPRQMAMQALFPPGRSDLPSAGSMPAVPRGQVSGTALEPSQPAK